LVDSERGRDGVPKTLYEKRNKVMHNSGPVILFSMNHHPGRECIRIPGM
jgi:hypothetical protein